MSLFKTRDILLPPQTASFVAIDEARPDICAKGTIQYNKHKGQTQTKPYCYSRQERSWITIKTGNGCKLRYVHTNTVWCYKVQLLLWLPLLSILPSSVQAHKTDCFGNVRLEVWTDRKGGFRKQCHRYPCLLPDWVLSITMYPSLVRFFWK